MKKLLAVLISVILFNLLFISTAFSQSELESTNPAQLVSTSIHSTHQTSAIYFEVPQGARVLALPYKGSRLQVTRRVSYSQTLSDALIEFLDKSDRYKIYTDTDKVLDRITLRANSYKLSRILMIGKEKKTIQEEIEYIVHVPEGMEFFVVETKNI